MGLNQKQLREYGITGKPVFDATKHTHQEWLDFRKTGIGGSDVGAVLGLNKYTSSLKLYGNKLSLIPDFKGNNSTEWGIKLEPLVRDEFAMRNSEFEVYECDFTIQHPDHKIANCNVDGIIYDPETKTAGVYEGNTASIYMAKDWNLYYDEDGNEKYQIPDYYQLQVQWNMGVTGLLWGFVAVLIGGSDYRDIRVEFDQELFNIMLAESNKFWNENVLKNIPPPPDGSKSSGEYIKSMYPYSNDVTLDLSLENDVLEACENYKQAMKDEKLVKVRKELAGQQLKLRLKENGKAICHNHKVNNMSYPRSTISSKLIKTYYMSKVIEFSMENKLSKKLENNLRQWIIKFIAECTKVTDVRSIKVT